MWWWIFFISRGGDNFLKDRVPYFVTLNTAITLSNKHILCLDIICIIRLSVVKLFKSILYWFCKPRVFFPPPKHIPSSYAGRIFNFYLWLNLLWFYFNSLSIVVTTSVCVGFQNLISLKTKSFILFSFSISILNEILLCNWVRQLTTFLSLVY